MGQDVIVQGFGCLLIVGGFIGYMKKASTVSLLMGGGSGAFFVLAGNNLDKFIIPARALASILCIVMINRSVNTGKFMPAGMVGALSFGMLVYLFSR